MIQMVKYFSKRYPLLLTGNILLLVIVNLAGVASIFSIAPIIDMIINPDMSEASGVTQAMTSWVSGIGLPVTLSSMALVFLAFQFLKSGLNIIAQYCFYRMKYVVLQDLMIGTFKDFFRARWQFFSGQQQGVLYNTFNRELLVAGDSFGTIAAMAVSFIQLCFYLAIPFYLSWQVTMISLGAALLFASPFLYLSKVSYRLGQRNTSTANEVNVILQESLTSAKLILGFGNQKKSIANLEEAFAAHCRATMKSQTLGIATPQMYEPLALVVVVIALFAAQRFALPLAEMGVMLWALRLSVPAIGSLTSQRNILSSSFPSYEQIEMLRARAKSMQQQSGQKTFERLVDAITVENFTFCYDDNSPVLQDVSLTIPKGSMVALVGASGAGKSTLIDSIMGFNQSVSGRIAVDGVSLAELEIDSYRQRIGYVPQESVLFNLSIRDNLLWAKEDATDAEIEDACRRANAHEFIESFRDGYETLVGDRGVRLSGGECQRVALARAILRKPELLILDEATSHLDSHSEKLIREAIETIAEGTTIIAIAHRLSTIARANNIYVLDKGRVVEEGTYSELKARMGTFSQMAELQSVEKALPNSS